MKDFADVRLKRVEIACKKLVVYVKIVAFKKFHATYVMLV